MQALRQRWNPYLLVALSLALAYHGGLLLTGTFKRTYDAYIHIFLANHYALNWFDHWDYSWYTGFTLTSYPPGSHQAIALLSYVIGLLNGFIAVQLFAVLFVVVGAYRFSQIWVSEEAAGYASLLAVFASSICETVHVFGQLPTMFSLGFLLNALPYVRRWLDEGKWKWLILAWLMNAATTSAHHVTTLFGAVFFVGPVIVAAIVEKLRQPLPDESSAHPSKITWKIFWPLMIRRLRRIVPVVMRAGIYGPGLIGALVIVVLPYWLYSKSDPITQVPIPHASRDSFLVNTNAGIVFWLLPWGLDLIALPYAFYKGLTTKAWPLALSLGALFFLGTGGTTPFPKMLLGGAYDILTLDRFTFWGTISVLPLLGEFVVSLRHRGLAKYTREQFGLATLRGVQALLVISYLVIAIVTANFTQFRRFQPAPIDMQPIVNFLEKDQHSRWRYLPLGFGDQMAWLSAQTTATTVDGNYNSARRLPELTTTSVERLEGAKFRGLDGIGSLQQFLAVPEKYNLKFVLSNDQFYDPLLFFSGWHRLQRLENGIMVWEREDIPPLPEVLPRKEIPVWQRVMWGTVPLLAIAGAILGIGTFIWGPPLMALLRFLGVFWLVKWIPRPRLPGRKLILKIWPGLDHKLRKWSELPGEDESRVVPWQIWLVWLQRFPRPKPASPTARQVRTALLVLIGLGLIANGVFSFIRQARDPVAIVQAYYDDLDFRRFSSAYARLDPQVRPTYEQYLLELSVTNGLVASYGKLDSVKVQVLISEPDRVVVQADTVLITSMSEYDASNRLTLVKRKDQWYIVPTPSEATSPPDQFFSRSEVKWQSQGRRQVTTGTTSFNDVLDRPILQILSARLVKVQDRYSVVGEVINTDVNPADVTVTAVIFDDKGKELTTYNAQFAMIHKLLPKEVTPFRVDFEGVAGAALDNPTYSPEFKPGAYTPVKLKGNIAAFDVYAKAVVTSRDLYRDVGPQDIKLTFGEDGLPHISGQLINSGTGEATIPHMLITYYDDKNQVVWVDQAYIENAIRSQRTQPFNVPLTPIAEVKTIIDKGDLFANNLQNELQLDPSWRERIKLPEGMGYSSLRLSLHYFQGGDS